MSEADPLRRYVEAGIAFTQLTKAKAEAVVRDLVKAGDVQREQAQDWVDELLDRSRKSSDSLVALIRSEMAQQLSSMGFATRQDLARLEARVDHLEAATPAATAATATTATTARAGPSTGQAGKATTKATKVAKGTNAAKAGKATTKATKAGDTTKAGKVAQPGARAATTAARGAGAAKAAGAARPGTASRTTAATSPPRRSSQQD